MFDFSFLLSARNNDIRRGKEQQERGSACLVLFLVSPFYLLSLPSLFLFSLSDSLPSTISLLFSFVYLLLCYIRVKNMTNKTKKQRKRGRQYEQIALNRYTRLGRGVKQQIRIEGLQSVSLQLLVHEGCRCCIIHVR